MSILKDHTGKGSAGRVVCVGLSAVVAFRLFYFTLLGVALGIPDAVIVVVAFFSVAIYKHFEGEAGVGLISGLLDKLSAAAPGVNAVSEVITAVKNKITQT